MKTRRYRLTLVSLMALLLLTGCGTTVRDGVSAGVEDGIAAAIGAFAEALIDATFGTTP